LRRVAGEPWVALDGLRGRLCDGDAAGFLRINSDTSDYELSLTLQNVSLTELLPRRTADPAPPRRGEADANIFLRGQAGQSATRQGGGELRIRGGSFLHTPVLSQVAEAGGPQRQRISDDLDLAELRFVWQGQLIRLTRVDIQSRDLRLVGEGTWSLDSDALDLTLVGAHPRHWPRVAVLSDLLESARRDLVQYRVQGTMAAPRITVEPLYKLTDTLRALLGGG
jgi:hypothetical protein